VESVPGAGEVGEPTGERAAGQVGGDCRGELEPGNGGVGHQRGNEPWVGVGDRGREVAGVEVCAHPDGTVAEALPWVDEVR